MNQVIGSVGSAATSLLGGLLTPLMGQSAAMLQQGIGLAAQMMRGKGAGSGETKGNNVVQQATDQPLVSSASKDMTGASPDNADALTKETTNFASILSAGSVVGGLAAMASGFDGARSGINEATRHDLRSEGGKSMSGAGAKLAQNIANMISSGIFNQLISKFHNTTTGIAKTEQVGQVMVTTVGQVHLEQVGHTRKIIAGEEFTVAVGPARDENGNPVPPKALLVMKSDGSIVLKGVKIYLDASGPIEQAGSIINLN